MFQFFSVRFRFVGTFQSISLFFCRFLVFRRRATLRARFYAASFRLAAERLIKSGDMAQGCGDFSMSQQGELGEKGEQGEKGEKEKGKVVRGILSPRAWAA